MNQRETSRKNAPKSAEQVKWPENIQLNINQYQQLIFRTKNKQDKNEINGDQRFAYQLIITSNAIFSPSVHFG